MKFIKQLAGQTAIYGMGTIVPRFLNYALLTPFYTRIFSVPEYGVVTELYAYMAILLVLLTYGMETTYFRFATSSKNSSKAYNTAQLTLLVTSSLFILGMVVFTKPLAELMQYGEHPGYIMMFSVIIGIDAFTSIPFARLRLENKVVQFSILKLINVLIIVAVAVTFLWIIPGVLKKNPESFFSTFYSDDIGVGYVFIANLCGSLITLLLLMPQIVKARMELDAKMFMKMITYTFPLLIAGLAGVINDSFDKVAFKHLIQEKETSMHQLGIYGANYKIAVLMGLFVQMFRYAAEPFFFSKAKEKNAKEIYAQVMNYFVLSSFVIFLGIALNVEIFKYLIDLHYWGALDVVPIVLLSYVFYGIFVNLSVWYKLNDITKYAAILTITGAIITLGINFGFVAKYGYYAAAWGHSAAYFIMVLASYYLGKRIYPVPYNVFKLGMYFLATLAIFIASKLVRMEHEILQLAFNNMMILVLVGFIYFKEIRGKMS